MQSETTAGFARSIRQGILAQHRAAAQFQKLGGLGIPQVLRSQALEAYFGHWLAKSPAEKKRLLDRSWGLARKSLRLFEASKNSAAYIETYNRLTFGVALNIECDGSLRSRIRKTKEAIQYGKKALLMAESAANKQDYAECLVKTSIFLNALADDDSIQEESGKSRREALQLWQKATRIDKETTIREISHPLSGFHQALDPGLSLQICKEALQIAKPQRDNFAIGRLMDQLAKWTHYAAQSRQSGDDPTLGPRLRAEALGYAEAAAQRYDTINFTSSIAGALWVHSPYTEHFQELARYETDPTRRRRLLEKGFRSTGELLRLAKQSQNERVMFYAFHTCYKCEVVLAASETNERRRGELLLKAQSHAIQAYNLVGQVCPSTSWNRGVTTRAVADVFSKLAQLERGSERRCQLLLQAAAKLEEGLAVTTAYVSALQRPPHPTLIAQIGQYYWEYADILKQLAPLTNQEGYLRKAVTGYSAAADWFERIPRYDRLAECYWKLAETYDLLQAYSLASENFILAARAYSKLGRRVLPLKEHSEDYGRYLIAWSKIEQARASHVEDQHQTASGLYNSAARLHRSTKRWRFLAPYYSAREKLERGESLSKQGRRPAAASAFRQAGVMFAESAAKLGERLLLTDQLDEKKMVEELLKAPRVQYSQTREILEQAMEAESQEDFRTSYEKFRLASEKLKEILNLSTSEQDRREIQFLSVLCEAWLLSCKAEIDNSSEPLKAACAQFEMAKDIGLNQTATKLASGHASFCKALISIHEFAETQDPSLHNEASKQLDIASRYYLEAGSKTASAHATGRRMLIEAFGYLDIASKRKGQDEKARLYRSTTALLREAVRLFVRAQQPKKAELARSFLKKAAVESKIASELTSILDASQGRPTNIAFQTHVNDNEKPAGLDRFEGGDLEARFVKVTTGLPPAGVVELEIEITNTGKQPIRLVSLDSSIPKGAELIEASEKWVPKGQSLIGTLRRLDTLQTERVRIKFRTVAEGLLLMQPKVTFVDMTGLQLERLIEPRVLANSRIIEFLASSFLEDYSRRLAIQICGWRTFMAIADTLKIPRSHLYGEPRYGRSFGRQLDALVKSSVVEYRIFPKERGRGGEVTKVRVNLDNECVNRYFEETAARGGQSFSPLRRLSSNMPKV